MKKNHNGLWIVTSVCLCLCLTSTISAMQMGGFDIDVGNVENSRTMDISMILIQETEHRIIYSNGMVYSRITLTGITAVNGTIILSGIIILRIIMPRIITFRVIMPGIIILHGTLNLRQITICR